MDEELDRLRDDVAFLRGQLIAAQAVLLAVRHVCLTPSSAEARRAALSAIRVWALGTTLDAPRSSNSQVQIDGERAKSHLLAALALLDPDAPPPPPLPAEF